MVTTIKVGMSPTEKMYNALLRTAYNQTAQLQALTSSVTDLGSAAYKYFDEQVNTTRAVARGTRETTANLTKMSRNTTKLLTELHREFRGFSRLQEGMKQLGEGLVHSVLTPMYGMLSVGVGHLMTIAMPVAQYLAPIYIGITTMRDTMKMIANTRKSIDQLRRDLAAIRNRLNELRKGIKEAGGIVNYFRQFVRRRFEPLMGIFRSVKKHLRDILDKVGLLNTAVWKMVGAGALIGGATFLGGATAVGAIFERFYGSVDKMISDAERMSSVLENDVVKSLNAFGRSLLEQARTAPVGIKQLLEGLGVIIVGWANWIQGFIWALQAMERGIKGWWDNLVKSFEIGRNNLLNAFNWFKERLESVANVFIGIWNRLVDSVRWFVEMINSFVNAVSGVLSNIPGFGGIASTFSDIASSISSAVENALSGIVINVNANINAESGRVEATAEWGRH